MIINYTFASMLHETFNISMNRYFFKAYSKLVVYLNTESED